MKYLLGTALLLAGMALVTFTPDRYTEWFKLLTIGLGVLGIFYGLKLLINRYIDGK